MNVNSNVTAWMIVGGPRSTDAASDRNADHLRALKASRANVASTGLASRFASLIAAVRPTAAPVDPACCPA